MHETYETFLSPHLGNIARISNDMLTNEYVHCNFNCHKLITHYDSYSKSY